MKKLVLTGYSGDQHSQMAEQTVPLMLRYANRHCADFECRNLAGRRPASWMKVSTIHEALHDFDAVLWIDVDVVVADSSLSIFEFLDCQGKFQALVEHKTECGDVPNCGVWLLRSEMRDHLKQIWTEERNIHHPWWEQASVIERMGYEVHGAFSRRNVATPLFEGTVFLGSEWNHHPRDERRCDIESARFIHVTQYDNRLRWIDKFAWSAR